MKPTTQEHAEDRAELGMQARQLARADLNCAIDRAIKAGMPWEEVVRIVGEPADPSQRAQSPSQRLK